jgi:phospholipid/cholesterol/gamma-HCH transport system substrate-binding protein
VTETFANANDTLGAINRALETGERTLVAAESALTGADALINDEIATLVRPQRQPRGAERGRRDGGRGPAGDLRRYPGQHRRGRGLRRLQGLVDASSPGVQEFTTERLADRSRGWRRKPARSSPISGS